MEKKDDRIRSLVRGLDVLAAVNDMAPVKVASLVDATGLPKPTLIRILNTLISENYIAKRGREAGGGYFPTPRVRLLASAFAQGSILSQVAQSHLNNLCEIVKWPTEMLVRDGLSMLIESSNRQISPITLKRFEQKRFPILTTGSGQAYLAWLSEAQRWEIITASLATMTGPPRAPYDDRDKTERFFKKIRSTGYIQRDYDTPIEGTRVYCVPVINQERPVAVLALVTLRDVVLTEHFKEKILAPLQNTANAIARDFQIHSKTPAAGREDCQ